MKTFEVSELREHITEHINEILRLIEEGEIIALVENGRVIAHIVPAHTSVESINKADTML